MILALALHVIVFLVLGGAMDRVYGRWVRRSGVPAGKSLLVGLAILVLKLAWLVLPLLNPRMPLDVPSTSTLRRVEFWLGWSLASGAGVLVSLGIARAWWAVRQLQAFRSENAVGRMSNRSPDGLLVHQTSISLEKQYRRFSRTPRLAVRFSWLTLSPILTGTARPTLYLPMTLLEERQGIFLEPILDHEAGHLRLRHHWIYAVLAWLARLLPFTASLVSSIGKAMTHRVDRDIRGKVDEAAWNRYVHAIQEVMPTQVDWSPTLAIPHHARETPGRVRQMCVTESFHLLGICSVCHERLSGRA